ncbi:MAG: hypothetical protein ACYS99_22190 [Planctomycetota bacterium]
MIGRLTAGLLILSAAACGAESDPGEGTARKQVAAAEIDLASAVRFLDRGGEEVAAPPATYRVEQAGTASLILRSVESEALKVAAVPARHALELDAPEAVLVTRDPGDEAHLVLLLPGGDALSARGTRREVRERGLAEVRPVESWEIGIAYARALVNELQGFQETKPLAERVASGLEGLEPTVHEARALVDAENAAPPSLQRISGLLESQESGLQGMEREMRDLEERLSQGDAEVRQRLQRALSAVQGTLAEVGKTRAMVDEAEIYLGDPRKFEKPAVVDVDAVFGRIPEYQEIVRKDMDPSNPRYLFLLRSATKKFLAGLEAAAERRGYDLIGGLGSIRLPEKKVPEITALVVSLLPE